MDFDRMLETKRHHGSALTATPVRFYFIIIIFLLSVLHFIISVIIINIITHYNDYFHYHYYYNFCLVLVLMNL